MCMASGVLPVPPAVRLPMQMTGSEERYGSARRNRRATAHPYKMLTGRSARAIAGALPGRYHQTGSSRGTPQAFLVGQERNECVHGPGQGSSQARQCDLGACPNPSQLDFVTQERADSACQILG